MCLFLSHTFFISLIHHHVGKLREIKDSIANGGNYYQTLLTTSDFQRQIHLDIYRTMPSNKHFKMGGNGVSDNDQRYIYGINHMSVDREIAASFGCL